VVAALTLKGNGKTIAAVRQDKKIFFNMIKIDSCSDREHCHTQHN
jgi:hypothetical protein